MADQHHHMDTTKQSHFQQQQNDRSTTKIIAVLTFFPIGGFCFLLAALILTGTLIFVSLATPLFVIFSPVIVPALLSIGLAITGFMTSGAFGITGLTALIYIVNYFRNMSYRGTSGGDSLVQEQLDYGKNKGKDTAGYVGQKVAQGGSRSSYWACDTLIFM